MNNWKRIAIDPDTSIIEAMKVIEQQGSQFVVIVDSKDKLLGSLTDGDIRRGLLQNIPLTAAAKDIMNRQPLALPASTSRKQTKTFMSKNKITHVPLIQSDGTIVELVSLEEVQPFAIRENTVVLMLGGLGSRLGELTSNCPKPMLKVGGKPILEIILDNLCEHGFNDFIFCVNYRAEMIESYFGNGEKFKSRIRYILESKRMGTAGALALLPSDIRGPLLVMNGDIITKVNFSQLLDYHLKHPADATMGVRKYDFQIPFGVVKTEYGKIQSIEEKPIHNFLVSAGIYIVNQSCLNYVPFGEFFDMPQLFEKLITNGKSTQAFPIHEYWLDIGREDDFMRAQEEFNGGAK